MSTSRLLSFLTHCKDIALLIDCDHVLGLQLDNERASVWREEDKGKITRSVHRSGLRSLFPAEFNRGKPSCGNSPGDLGMSEKLGGWPGAAQSVSLFSFRERKAVTSALGPPLLCGLES